METMRRWYSMLFLVAFVLVALFTPSECKAPSNLRSKADLVKDNDLRNGQKCSCSDDILCLPLGVAAQKNPTARNVQLYLKKREKHDVFAFMLPCNSSVWSKFHWSKITTLAVAGEVDSELLCHAHENGVPVVTLGNIPTKSLTNATARSMWVEEAVANAQSKALDGINIDFEDAIADGSPEVNGLTALVEETVSLFHEVIHGSQVSVDFAWKAGGVDGRFYDYKTIGAYADLVFIMAYDEQSQIFDEPCDARPNSDIHRAQEGIQSYIDLGILPEKLILGLPWYGYRYPCVSLDSNETCFIEEVPFRGVNCSDAAGKEYAYSYMVATKKEYNATYHWDKDSMTPYYTIKENSTGQYIQMRYDDELSLAEKYALAIRSSLRGVGMWTANFLDYSDTPEALIQQAAMWGLLP